MFPMNRFRIDESFRIESVGFVFMGEMVQGRAKAGMVFEVPEAGHRWPLTIKSVEFACLKDGREKIGLVVLDANCLPGLGVGCTAELREPQPENGDEAIEWHQCSPLPVFVRFHYPSPTGEHPLTMPAVRERYLRQVTNSALVIWRTTDFKRFGVRAGIDEFACRTDDCGRFEFGYTQPAKGAGNIWLCTSKETILSADRFSPDLLTWFKQIASILNQMFPNAVVEKDNGYDA